MSASAGLIGATGFVGTTLSGQAHFEDYYHSKNISEIRGRTYGLLLCAGAPAAKWKANQNPEEDLANLNGLMEHLRHVTAERFVLISTVDVFARPVAVDEATPVDPAQADTYGRNRFLLEEFVRKQFPQACVARLPGLFGHGLKKNFVYDLLHTNCLHLTHCESVFQFYDMSRLWSDVQIALASGLPLVHFATAPVKVRDVARQAFDVAFENVTPKPPVHYDLRTRHAAVFGGAGDYFYSATETCARIARFVQEFRASAAS